MDQVTQLYRHYDAKNVLLYVGISRHAGIRFRSHRKTTEWAARSVRMVVEHYPSRLLASIAELKAVEKEKPLYNKAHLERAKLKNKCPPAATKLRRDEDTIMISVRLPISLVEKINQKCKAKKVTRSKLIEDAINKHLGR